MGVQRNHRRFAIGQIAAEIFDLVGIDIGGRRLDRGGQVEDDRPILSRADDFHHRFAYLEAEIEFSGGEGFRAVFKLPFCVRPLGRFIDEQLSASDGDLAHIVAAHPEHDFAPCRADGVIKMDNGRMRAFEAFETALDQIFTALREHLNHHVIRDPA